MAALLGKQLILDMHGGGAGLLKLLDRAHGVQSAAVADISVDDQGKIGGALDHTDMEAKLLQCHHAEIGQPHGHGGRAAGYVQRLEPGLLRQQSGEGVMRAGNAENFRPGEKFPQPVAREPDVARAAFEKSHAFRPHARVFTRVSKLTLCTI